MCANLLVEDSCSLGYYSVENNTLLFAVNM